MRIIAKKILREFWLKHRETEDQLSSWIHIAEKANWKKPNDIKNIFKTASIIVDNRVVFNICGNNYRLTVKINYDLGIIFVRFIGTHKDYDKIDARTI